MTTIFAYFSSRMKQKLMPKSLLVTLYDYDNEETFHFQEVLQ